MALTQKSIEALRTCAFCPNTCRPSYPAQEAVQIESQTPSALCLLALSLLSGRLERDSGTELALNRRTAALASRGHCGYGLDISPVLDEVLAAIGE